MRHWLAGLLLLVAPQALAQQAVPTIAFESVPNPLTLPPNMYFGEASGVSLNSKGHVFVLSRGRLGEVALYGPAPQTSYDSAKPDDRFFTLLDTGEDGSAFDARLELEKKFDPDIWIVEIEDREGRAFVDENIA